MSSAPLAALDANSRIELHDVGHRFGETTALTDVSLSLRAGTVHALLGENGAGKTTLMRVAFGLLTPDRGGITAGGRPIASAPDAIAAGIGMVHQHFTNVPAMTVAENVALGGRGRFSAKHAAERVREIGERTGLVLDPAALAGDLPVGAQQRLEIVKALARDANTLILDEPTAVLAPNEAAELLVWMRAFADRGGAIVFVTHRLREALDIADDVTVLRRGRLVLTAPAGSVDERSLTRAMLGDDMIEGEAELDDSPPLTTQTVLRFTGVDAVDERGVRVIRDASFSVAAGEVLGIAAIEGSGHRELLRLAAGRAAPARGTVDRPSAIGFVPEDRQRDALALDLSLAENVALRGAGERRGRISWRDATREAENLVYGFDIRAANVDVPARVLSGGNQQKLVLARELHMRPRLVVAENPSRGLDIRAARAVRELLRRSAADGAAVVVYSSDLDEVLSLATRVLVVHAGQVHETPRDREAVGRAMLGVA